MSAAASANPKAMPAPAIRKALPANMRSRSAERAPSAMRMPNSRVRWLTEKASTPKMPMAASARARAPNEPTSCARKPGCAVDCAATREAAASSCSVNARPRSSGIPSVSKYAALTI